jgi:hypothetical protein
MAQFDHDTYRSLNASISQVQNPQAALNEALEYTAALEEVLLALCEELGLDPQAVMESALAEGEVKGARAPVARPPGRQDDRGSYASYTVQRRDGSGVKTIRDRGKKTTTRFAPPKPGDAYRTK